MFHVKRLLQRDEHREKETNRHNDHNERTPSQPTPLPHIRKAKGRAPEEVAPEHTIVEPRSSSTGTPKKKLRSTLTGIIERLSKRRIDERNCIVATIQFKGKESRFTSGVIESHTGIELRHDIQVASMCRNIPDKQHHMLRGQHRCVMTGAALHNFG